MESCVLVINWSGWCSSVCEVAVDSSINVFSLVDTMFLAGKTMMLLLLPATIWSAPANTPDPPNTIYPVDFELTTLHDTELQRSEDFTTTENYDTLEEDNNATDVASLRTELIFSKLKKLAIVHKGIYTVIYEVARIFYKFWRVILNVVWKPILKLYISPLRLIHSYLLPELISAECFDVYHGDINRYHDPLKPFRPDKLELVKCIFQYLGHYFRSWQFVNRIEGNNYNLV